MKHLLRIITLTLGAVMIMPAGHAQPAGRSNNDWSAADTQAVSAMARDVREIAEGAGLSVAKKEKRIATVVRVALVAATAYKSEPARNLALAVEFASAASRSAPRFTEVIVNAVAFTPAVSRIDGATGQIRAAAFAATKPQNKRPMPAVAQKEQTATASIGPRQGEYSRNHNAGTTMPTDSASEGRPDREAAVPPVPVAGIEMIGSSDNPSASRQREVNGSRFRLPLPAGTSLHFTTGAGVQYDDNVYLTKNDKVSDVIFSVSPGIDFGFGQNSLTNGTLAYQLEFLRYRKHTTPSARLSHLVGDFGYNDEILKLSAGGSYSETYQNTRDVITTAARSLFQTNTLTTKASAEIAVAPKVSVGTGAQYDRVSYDQPELVGNRQFTVPLNVYYKATPKVDLSAGFSYRTDQSLSGGPKVRDQYYHLGARGSFTPKLSGDFSVGQRKRRSADGHKQSMPGYYGSFSYEVTPKTGLQLVAGRDYSTGVQGESLKNSKYTMGLSTAFNSQWESSVSVTYQQVDYGRQLFSNAPSNFIGEKRRDDYWAESLTASYIYTSWLNVSASFTHRNNSSTIEGVDFSNNLIGFNLSLRF